MKQKAESDLWRSRTRVRMRHAIPSVLIATLAVVGCRRSGFVELEFSTPSAIASAIDKGWLPPWFPTDVKNMSGVQEVFDDDFIWLGLDLGMDIETAVSNHCDPKVQSEAGLPAVDFMSRFSPVVVEEHRRASSKGVAYFWCKGTGREFRVAVEYVAGRMYFWAF